MVDDPEPTKKSATEPTPDGPPEVDDAARQETEYPSDETDEG
jgi:hypothetical protein